jgi:hypothetical protein
VKIERSEFHAATAQVLFMVSITAPDWRRAIPPLVLGGLNLLMAVGNWFEERRHKGQ